MSTPQPDPSQHPQQPYPQQPYGQPQGGQPSYGPPPQGWSPQPQMPPAPEKRKGWFARHKVLTGLGALVLVAIIGANLGGGDDDGGAGSTGVAQVDGDGTTTQETDVDTFENDEPKAEETEKLPAVGDKARDGKFEFTVTELEDGVPEIGDQFLSEKAQGQFVLVHMTVENIGDEAQYFDGDSQEMVDTKGRTHSADTAAAIYLGDSNSFLNEINPGNKVEGVVVFDIPKKAIPATLTLHDSMFSGGVQVALK